MKKIFRIALVPLLMGLCFAFVNYAWSQSTTAVQLDINGQPVVEMTIPARPVFDVVIIPPFEGVLPWAWIVLSIVLFVLFMVDVLGKRWFVSMFADGKIYPIIRVSILRIAQFFVTIVILGFFWWRVSYAYAKPIELTQTDGFIRYDHLIGSFELLSDVTIDGEANGYVTLVNSDGVVVFETVKQDEARIGWGFQDAYWLGLETYVPKGMYRLAYESTSSSEQYQLIRIFGASHVIYHKALWDKFVLVGILGVVWLMASFVASGFWFVVDGTPDEWNEILKKKQKEK